MRQTELKDAKNIVSHRHQRGRGKCKPEIGRPEMADQI